MTRPYSDEKPPKFAHRETSYDLGCTARHEGHMTGANPYNDMHPTMRAFWYAGWIDTDYEIDCKAADVEKEKRFGKDFRSTPDLDPDYKFDDGGVFEKKIKDHAEKLAAQEEAEIGARYLTGTEVKEIVEYYDKKIRDVLEEHAAVTSSLMEGLMRAGNRLGVIEKMVGVKDTGAVAAPATEPLPIETPEEFFEDKDIRAGAVGPCSTMPIDLFRPGDIVKNSIHHTVRTSQIFEGEATIQGIIHDSVKVGNINYSVTVNGQTIIMVGKNLRLVRRVPNEG